MLRQLRTIFALVAMVVMLAISLAAASPPPTHSDRTVVKAVTASHQTDLFAATAKSIEPIYVTATRPMTARLDQPTKVKQHRGYRTVETVSRN